MSLCEGECVATLDDDDNNRSEEKKLYLIYIEKPKEI